MKPLLLEKLDPLVEVVGEENLDRPSTYQQLDEDGFGLVLLGLLDEVEEVRQEVVGVLNVFLVLGVAENLLGELHALVHDVLEDLLRVVSVSALVALLKIRELAQVGEDALKDLVGVPEQLVQLLVVLLGELPHGLVGLLQEFFESGVGGEATSARSQGRRSDAKLFCTPPKARAASSGECSSSTLI